MIRHSQPSIGAKDYRYILRVLNSLYIATGSETKKLEQQLCKLLRVKQALATNSGTSALHLALLALGIKGGDSIIMPSFVCASVLNAVMYARAKPIICDVDKETFNLSIDSVKDKIAPNTKAIILPHMFGLPADIDEFLKLGIPIIEDCAQSLGATYKEKITGSFGKMAIFSFYATKVITTAQGGAIASNSDVLMSKAKDLIEYDERRDYKIRYNYKMTDLQSALGLSQLKRLMEFIKIRRQIAKTYNTKFYGYNVDLPDDPDDRQHIYYRYVIKINSPLRDFIRRLKSKGIEAKPPVFMPLHRYLGLNKNEFPNTEEAFRRAISIPIYPSLSKKEITYIIKEVSKLL